MKGDSRAYMKSAQGYVEIAERANGPISKPVEYSYIWGDALNELEKVDPDLRIINLETSITTSEEYWPGKGINYRMHPDNIDCLRAVRIDFCSLANNHILDWGYPGLTETVETLKNAGWAAVSLKRSSRSRWGGTPATMSPLPSTP